MSTLQAIEDQIAMLERGELGPRYDEDGDPVPATPSAICERLYSLEGDLRRTLWSAPYRQWARDLYERADREVRRLCDAHGLMYGGRAPLFPGGPDPNTGATRRAIP